MKPTALLYICKKNGVFKKPFEKEVHNGVVLLSVKNRNSTVKKLMKNLSGGNTVIAHGYENEAVFTNRKTVFKNYSLDTVLPVVGALCRKTAEKFGLKIPFAEVYIEASPAVACGILTGIQSMSRIFTVISEEPPLTNVYDELYFKQGTIIRHLTGYCNNLTHEAVIIRCDTKYNEWDFDIPVINFTLQREQKSLTVNAIDVCIKDERIDDFLKYWGGQGGLLLYELLGEIPSENAQIDINRKADEIFLLDTDKN